MSPYSQIVEHVVTAFEVVGAGVMTIGGAIVLIRTVLSFSLDVEIDGVLPWRRAEQDYESRGAA